MARKSKWSAEDRKKLVKMVNDGVPEQDIREQMAISGKEMTSVEFAQQFKMAMVESGHIKQRSRGQAPAAQKLYTVSDKGRLNLTDFSEITGFQGGAKFALEKPRGKSQSWRLTPK